MTRYEVHAPHQSGGAPSILSTHDTYEAAQAAIDAEEREFRAGVGRPGGPAANGYLQRTIEPVREIVGLSEISDRLKVHPQTVKGWRHRGLLPDPVGTVSGAPAYDWQEVQEWYRESAPKLGRPTK